MMSYPDLMPGFMVKLRSRRRPVAVSGPGCGQFPWSGQGEGASATTWRLAPGTFPKYVAGG